MKLENIGNFNMGRENIPDMHEEIKYSKTNKLLLNRISEWFLLEKQAIFSFPLLSKYENVLKSNLLNYELDKKYHYRPEYLSNDVYGTTDLWYLIMYVNNIHRVDDFNMKEVKLFPESIIDALNDIINQEDKDILGTENNPKAVYKHFVKSLEEESTNIIPKYNRETIIPFVPDTKFYPSLNKITDDRYIKERYSVIENKFYIPDSDNKDLVEPFTLNNKGLTSLPHFYYTKGFKRKFKGKIKFQPGELYTYLPLHNGKSSIRVYDEKGFDVVNIKESFQFKAPILIFDFRSASDKEIKPVSLESTKSSYIKFNQETGLYEIKSSVFNRPDNENSKEVQIAKVVIDNKTDNPRMKLSRIIDNDYLGINLGYSTKFKDDKATAQLFYEVQITLLNGKTKTFKDFFVNDKSLFNTKGKKSFLKHIMRNEKNITKMEVIIKLMADEVPTTDIISVGIDELEISGINYTDFKNEFTVIDDKWYTVEIDYEYLYKNSDGSNFFYDESRAGLYFNPQIVVVRPYGVYPVNNQIYTGFYNKRLMKTSIGRHTYVSFIEGRTMFDENSLTYMYSKDFRFSRNYIMTFKMTDRNKTGGAGIIFDYNNSKKSGYMIWLASEQENWDVPYFNKADNEERIKNSGFYEMDTVFGKPSPIFKKETENQLYLTNHFPFDPDEKWIKIIKKDNRIRVYVSTNKTFDHSSPIVDMKDIENINYNGQMAFVSAFGGIEIEFDSYYEYEDIFNY